MEFNRKNYSDDTLLHLYRALLKPRLIEEKMLILLRQGKITKWFSGIGQEAISVGAAEALHPDEYMMTMHRNLGVFTSRNLPYDQLFAQFQGKPSGYTKGRDRSFHFGTNEHHVVGMISHLGPQLSVADGISLAHILKGEKKVSLAFTGDGASSEGEFHEAINVAAVWDLPVIFLVEHNGYGLSTPNNEQFRFQYFTDKAAGYGIEAVRVDGNNILEVYDTVKQLAESMREKPRPVLLEAITFRMRGHEEASGTKYVPQELFDEWGKKDPIDTYENYLLEIGVIDQAKKEAIRAEIKADINKGVEVAFSEEEPVASTQTELADVYAPHESVEILPQNPKKSQKRYIDAITDALRLGMQKYPELVLMGQDIAEYGGAFKVTDNFVHEFGKHRVRNTPLCESAIVGAALGLSIKGMKAMVEMQFADFVSCAMTQICNNLAKTHWRWGQSADVVVRMPTGAGSAAGPFHSQSNEAWFFHTAGLKIVYPSNPHDAKGLLLASLADPNPIIFFEHKVMYRSVTEDIADDYYTVPIGKANLVSKGNDLSIITYGMGVVWAKQLMAQFPDNQVDILDLRTLLPWDKEAVAQTVKKTGKVLVCHEDNLTGGIGGEISAWIAENLFEYLDAPVMREGALDTPVPFSPSLEKNYLPKDRILEKIKILLEY